MLTLQSLESRAVPAATPLGYAPGYDPLPGFDGPYSQVSTGDLTVYVAGVGGSVRVRGTHYQTGEVAFDTVVLDPEFRGGGRYTVVDGDLVVAPGVGGGPVVAVIDLDTFSVTNRLLPYAESFRGGIRVANGDVNGDGVDELLTLPGEGGGPVLKAIDVRTGEEILSLLVGPIDDRTGYQFVSAGVGVQLAGPDSLGVYLQVGDDPLTTFGVTWSGVVV